MRRRNGFTLAEALIAATVLAVAVTAITMPFTAAAQNQLDDARLTLAGSWGQGLMEEILDKPFDDPDGPSDPGPESGETTRSKFDNIDDYHGFSESPGQMTVPGGQVVADPAAEGLSRAVTAEYVYVAGQDTSAPPDFIRVIVTVRYASTTLVTLTRLAYNP